MTIPNIGPRERRARRSLGIASGVAGVALLLVMSLWDAPRPWRLALFVPIFGAALGVLQAREKT